MKNNTLHTKQQKMIPQLKINNLMKIQNNKYKNQIIYNNNNKNN